MKVFVIGPGGVGKTTAGTILAQKIGYDFIDLDQEFCKQIENITSFVQSNGYKEYCTRNSGLFYKILDKAKKDDNVIFVLSSGFLVHEDMDALTTKHHQTLQREGLSILLLPSVSMETSAEIIVERQMSRGLGLNPDREREKFIKRFHEYQRFGDEQLFSHGDPGVVAIKMQNIIAKSN